jgi:hypothetical protein
MQGILLFYDPTQDAGFIRGADTNRYYFSKTDCFGGIVPPFGQEVDFLAQGNAAKEIVAIGTAPPTVSVPAAESLRPRPFDSPQNQGYAATKFIHNLPGVIASALLLVSLFIPYGDLNYSGVAGFSVPITQFKLANADLGILHIAGAVILLAVFTLGLPWNAALWTFVGLLGLSFIGFFGDDSLFSAVSKLETTLKTTSGTLSQLIPSATPPLPPAPGVFDFIKFGFYLHLLSLLALAYLVLLHPHEVRQSAVRLPAQMPDFNNLNLQETASQLKATVSQLNISSEGFQQAGESIENLMETTETKHSFFFHFIQPYLDYIDSGNFFRKPFYWLYALNAISILLLPVVLLFVGLKNNIFDMPFKFTLAFLLVLALMSFTSWIIFQLWWDRKDKVLATTLQGDDFIATPVFSHYIQTAGESTGTYIAIAGTGISIITAVLLGSESNYLGRSMGIGFLTGGSFLFIFVWPLVGFAIIIFTRFLAEMLRALVSIANNTKKVPD